MPEIEEDMANKTPEERMKELEAENKRLIKALELKKLQSEAYSTIPRIIHQLLRFLLLGGNGKVVS